MDNDARYGDGSCCVRLWGSRHPLRCLGWRLHNYQHGHFPVEKRDNILQNSQIVDRLFWWYAEQRFPPNRFDDISPIPDQIKVKAMSPLCHTSVSKWVYEAGVNIKTQEKIERCAKVAGEVAYTVTLALNEYFEGNWVAPSWNQSDETEHCIRCHGPAT